MVTVWCWLIIHSSNTALDNRQQVKIQGTIMREAGQNLLIVNFYEGFKAQKVNTNVNPVEQMVNENTCLYAK